MDNTELRWLADAYEQTQQMRIASENRMRAIAQGADDAHDTLFLKGVSEKFRAIEDDITKRMKKAVKDHPAWPWLSKVKGLGPALSTKLLGIIYDISNFETVSKLWRYAGLAVIDGQAERRKKGVKMSYNPRLKTIMYLIGNQMLKSNSQYRKIYDDSKSYYEANRPDWTKGRIHLASLRRMEKIFLSHLWEVWRKAEGLPTRETYVHEKLGHTSKYKPEDFVRTDKM